MSESLRSKRKGELQGEVCSWRFTECGLQSVPEGKGFGVLGQSVSEERIVGVIIPPLAQRDGCRWIPIAALNFLKAGQGRALVMMSATMS